MTVVPTCANGRLALRYIALCLALLFFASREGLAEPRAELLARMSELQVSVAEAQRAADESDGRVRQSEQELRVVRADIAKLRKEEQNLTTQLSAMEQSQTAAEAEVKRLTAEQMRVKARLRERIRAVYLIPKSSVAASLFSPASFNQIGLLNRYVEAVYQHDARLTQRYRDTAAKLSAQGVNLKTLLSKHKALVADLRVRKQKVADKLIAQERVASTARKNQQEQERTVAELRAKLLRFEATLTGLTGGRYEAEDGEENSVRQVDESFDGPGLKRGRGAPPAQGSTVTRFRGTRSDGQTSRGIEISTTGLASVTALGRGRAVFVGELPVLGSAVILDHGERFFTLYGRLANSVVVSGSVVEAGVPVGEAAGDKPLSFEVRQNGVPVDPRPFFAR